MPGDDITVHVDWLAHTLMNQQAAASSQRPTRSNYRLSRVPSHVRLNNLEGYTPKFVAIGPLHRDDPRLHPAQRLKVAYLHNLISRGHPDSGRHLGVMQDYVRCVVAREQEARAFYTEDILLSSNEFIQMMVLDGCFVIEHLVNHAIGSVEQALQATPFGPTQLSVDLILLENQIPFFILVDLITKTPLTLPEFQSNEPPVLLIKLALNYLAGKNGCDLSSELPTADHIFHLLHLLHAMITVARTRWEPPPGILDRPVLQAARTAARMLRRLPLLLLVPLLYPILPEERKWRASYGRDDVPCASDLKRMMVQFKKARAERSAGTGIAEIMGSPPLSLKLAHEDKLRMPQLRMEFRTAPLLLNLMALEQSVPDLEDNVAAFVSFMSKMVHSAEDAGVLVAAEVVHINSDGKEQVASLFRQLGAASFADLEGSYLAGMLEKLRKRSAHPLFMMWADVQRNYFTVPWAVVAEVVAFVTFISTMLQTYASFKKK